MALPENAAPILAQALGDLLGQPTAGSMAFIRCLPAEPARQLATDDRFAVPGWKIAIVSDQTDSSGRAITADVAVEWRERLDQAAVACDESLTSLLARAVEASSERVHRLVSGAGHDAMIVAGIAPVAMLFLRSPGGISHHPDESVLESDVEAALAVGVAFVGELESRYV